MDPVFKKKLQQARTTWASAKTRAESSRGMGETIEDGRYKARIKDATIGMSQSSNRLQVAWSYEILEGEFKGKTKMDWDGADTEDNQMWLGRKLVRLGYDIPDDLEDVESILAEIRKKKPVVRITLKTKGEFQKVYVDKVLSGEEAADEGGDDEGQEAEQAPTAQDEEAVLEKGMSVSFDLKGKDVVGKVLEILEEENKVRVQLDNEKIYKVSAEALTLVEDEEKEEDVEEDDQVPEEPEAGGDAEEEEEEKPKVVKKKPEVKRKK
jgi:hypothetical protein